MHLFLLKISEMLTECLIEILSDSQGTSSALKNKNPKQFIQADKDREAELLEPTFGRCRTG